MGNHSIQAGETLTKIAKMYGTTVKHLQELNGIKNANLIFAGTTIKVPDIESEDAFKIRGLTIESGDSSPAKQEVNNNQEVVMEPKDIATAKDMKLLERLGASKTTNDPSASAQFVVGDEYDEVSWEGGTRETPETITIKDNTNGDFNKYTYRLISDNEIASGKTRDGIPINKSQFEAGKGPYYILISAEDHEGNNLKNSHAEVYRLEYKLIGGVNSYDLIQEEGMDGSDRSSMDYSRR